MRLHPEWELTPERAAVHRPTATAVIADLHVGYDEARQRRGEAVPVRSLDEALAPLRALATRASIARLVIAGDLYEAAHEEALADELTAWLAGVGVRLVGLVPGNHDRGLAGARLPVCPDGIRIGDWLVIHGDVVPSRGRLVQGHVHPSLRWGSRIAAPCYLEGKRRLVLPAFSRDAAGVNVLREPRWRSYQCHAIAGERVLDFGGVEALTRRARQV